MRLFEVQTSEAVMVGLGALGYPNAVRCTPTDDYRSIAGVRRRRFLLSENRFNDERTAEAWLQDAELADPIGTA